MLYSEIIAVCSVINTKRINTLIGQKYIFLILNRLVYQVTSRL